MVDVADIWDSIYNTRIKRSTWLNISVKTDPVISYPLTIVYKINLAWRRAYIPGR